MTDVLLNGILSPQSPSVVRKAAASALDKVASVTNTTASAVVSAYLSTLTANAEVAAAREKDALKDKDVRTRRYVSIQSQIAITTLR